MLPAYRITSRHDDGHVDSYVTSMAEGVTLERAREYFMGHRFEVTETTFRIVIAVESVRGKE